MTNEIGRKFSGIKNWLNTATMRVLFPGKFIETTPAYPPEHRLTPEDYPNGYCIPLMRFLQFCRGGIGEFRSYSSNDAFFFLPPIAQALESAGMQLFESAASDIGQLAFDGISLGHLTNKFLPFTNDGDIFDILTQHKLLEGNSEEIHGLKKAFTSLLMVMNPDIKRNTKKVRAAITNQTTDIIRLNSIITNGLIRGPDIDGRLTKISPENIQSWISNLSHEIIGHFQHLQMFQETKTLNGKTITRVVFTEIPIKAWDRTNILSSHNPRKDQLMNPGYIFEYGIYEDSEIPYANIKWIAHEYGTNAADSTTDITLIDIGLSSHPSLMTEGQRNKDSRTGQNTVNNRNDIFVNLSTSPSQLAPGLPFHQIPTLENPMDTPKKERAFIGPHKIRVANGIVLPTAHGYWNNQGQYIIEAIDIDHFGIGNHFPESWIYLDNSTLQRLAGPIRFGENFGIKPSVETFLEFLRTIRYSLRTGSPIDSVKVNDQAFQIIRGESLVPEGNLPQLIDQAKQEGVLSSVNIGAIKEVASMLFFAPKEFIEYGRRASFHKYFVRWNIFEEIYEELPARDKILSDMTSNPNSVVYGVNGKKTGFDQVTQLVRKKYKNDKLITQMNDLELIYWLSGLI